MRRTRITKEDGRYLIFYTFEDEFPREEESEQDLQRNEKPKEEESEGESRNV